MLPYVFQYSQLLNFLPILAASEQDAFYYWRTNTFNKRSILDIYFIGFWIPFPDSNI